MIRYSINHFKIAIFSLCRSLTDLWSLWKATNVYDMRRYARWFWQDVRYARTNFGIAQKEFRYIIGTTLADIGYWITR